MLEPSQFGVNEAWIVFRLNDTPIRTEADGDFNVLCLMDAASCYILGTEFVPSHVQGAPESVVGRLVQTGRFRAHLLPSRVLVSADLATTDFAELAGELGLKMAAVTENELLPFTAEAREGFRAHISGSRRR